MDALPRVLLQAQGVPCRLMPCTVTSVSPLQISLLGGTSIPAVKIAGATYSLGQANALVSPGTQPIVLPIG